MQRTLRDRSLLTQTLAAAVEIGFIIFLFYSNLLMGEFTRSNAGAHTLRFAIRDIVTGKNMAIALVAAVAAHAVFEFLRRRL